MKNVSLTLLQENLKRRLQKHQLQSSRRYCMSLFSFEPPGVHRQNNSHNKTKLEDTSCVPGQKTEN